MHSYREQGERNGELMQKGGRTRASHKTARTLQLITCRAVAVPLACTGGARGKL